MGAGGGGNPRQVLAIRNLGAATQAQRDNLVRGAATVLVNSGLSASRQRSIANEITGMIESGRIRTRGAATREARDLIDIARGGVTETTVRRGGRRVRVRR